MSTSSEYCAACTTGQSCCTALVNLRVTPAEFEQHFARHRDRLTIAREGPVYRISGRDDGSCPHWNDGCDVYPDRPLECRMYPHTIGEIRAWRGHTILSYHSRPTGCPFTDELRSPQHVVRSQLAAFVQQAYGDGARVWVVHESRLYRGLRRAARLVVRGLRGGGAASGSTSAG